MRWTFVGIHCAEDFRRASWLQEEASQKRLCTAHSVINNNKNAMEARSRGLELRARAFQSSSRLKLYNRPITTLNLSSNKSRVVLRHLLRHRRTRAFVQRGIGSSVRLLGFVAVSAPFAAAAPFLVVVAGVLEDDHLHTET